jgi:pimeloyl-ACP methyl ester carboxylesterase
MASRRTIEAPSAHSAGVSGKLFITLAILALVVLVVMVGASAFLTYRVVTARDGVENITPANYLLSNFESVSFTDHFGGEHEGWLLLGLKRAPVVVLCHGYNSNRSELLPLGTLLRDNHFNVYLFNFQGPKGGKRFSNLGIREADDLVAALETITKHPAVNAQRVGVYGVSSGGYAALVAAERSPLVRALVADTVYDNPGQMLEFQIDQLLGGSSSVFHFLARTEFHLLGGGGQLPRLREDISKLEGVPKFFISCRDVPVLAEVTESLYSQASPPKRLLVLDRSQSGSASSEAEVEHNNQILGFFLQNLPLRAD